MADFPWANILGTGLLIVMVWLVCGAIRLGRQKRLKNDTEENL
jgi:hypothetical protein